MTALCPLPTARHDISATATLTITLQALKKLLASIKDRRKSQTAKSAPDAAVSDRVRHINTNTGRKESRVLLVNRMMNEAPDSVKQGKLNTVCSQICSSL